MRGRSGFVRVAVATAGLGGVTLLLLAVPDRTLAWTGAVLTAAAAALGQRVWDFADEAIKGRRAAHELESADPFTTDVRVRNIDYVALTEGDRVEDVPASGHTVQLTVTGALAAPVLLTDLRAEVISRSDRSGDLSRHAAEVPRRRFEVLLDAHPPRVRALGDSDFPYEITPHESEAFDLKISTDSGDVRWVLWLDWRSGSRSGSVQVDLGGQPFRTAGRDARRSRT
ncbi:hypothetical protein Q5762_03700 [Streptomyces sp. P9(2023)]|uniref:hypothetical protein n=1 Tax=Streptomyces sp. P9(2023) TaxID=3064394 RepID=UPI0028F459EA|nr:hypothetical protein [Streptomyces sp. P9(2023)]MDT9687458.1 hypothetical protein [Streptomyces sp. P9(2023)]